MKKFEPLDFNSSIDEEHFLSRDHEKIFMFRHEKRSFTKKKDFSIYFIWSVLIRNSFLLVVLIENRVPNKNKLNFLQTTANYSLIFQDN